MLNISEGELEIMEVLWEAGEPMSFGNLLKGFNDRTGRDWKKQTMGTFLTRMQQKNLVEASGGTRKKYSPCVSREEHVRDASESFLDRYYEGSFVKLFASLNGGERLNTKEVEELRQMLEDWEKE